MPKSRALPRSSPDAARHVALLANMLLQRAVDTRGYQLNRQGKIGIAMGSEGHEAVQAGVGSAFERGRDVLYPYYRNTGVLLACGFPLEDLFRSQFARATDRTKGRQIINHVTAHDLGIASFSSIVSAHLTHAVGTAYAFALRREHDRVVFATFGEGATSEGEWHEAINFSAIRRAPVVFICENNQWAISTPQSMQMAVPDVASKGEGYGIPAIVVDGFDPVAVYEAVRAARDHAVDGEGPTLIEAKCYRFLSHTTDDDDHTYRTREEVERFRRLDPIPRFERRLSDLGILDTASIQRLRAEITELVNRTTDAIEAESSPKPSDLYGNIYADSHEPWL
ncbi:MAG TPA: thiamine pyrophosphate-dependent dehydrogenase E1 component subunit alpha [Candidatus Baltobacteraceae bacterium]|jgi:2-oxoisovalerate dehydrogenase E1 component alpha subunit|nr:thiamine pyrophosphate-dependent dehydrogenase E1 component subunit alpha [Candidatus Baltobacteraceae bacterium]